MDLGMIGLMQAFAEGFDPMRSWLLGLTVSWPRCVSSAEGVPSTTHALSPTPVLRQSRPVHACQAGTWGPPVALKGVDPQMPNRTGEGRTACTGRGEP